MFDLEVVNSKKIGRTSTFTSVNQARCYRELMFLLKNGDEELFTGFLDEVLSAIISKNDSISVIDVSSISEIDRPRT